MAKPNISDTQQVNFHIQQLPANMQPAVQYLRELMLSIDGQVAEHIKWNSPAFYYTGEMKPFDPKEYKRDLLVMHLRKGKIMCVLPTGMNIRQNTSLLEGSYTDGRRMITFNSIDDIKTNEETFRATIREWLDLIEK